MTKENGWEMQWPEGRYDLKAKRDRRLDGDYFLAAEMRPYLRRAGINQEYSRGCKG